MNRVESLAKGVIADIIRRQPPSPARTAFAWQAAVGPDLARATTVELRDGVLAVLTRSPLWTAELERAADTVLARMQELLGATEVREIVIMVR